MKPPRLFATLVALAVGAALLPAPLAATLVSPAAAQSDTADPVQTLVQELREELDRAEKERLADPWFIRDMRTILDRYDWPWQTSLLYDDFSGQGPGPDAPWRVTAGEFLIDWRTGLRSVITPASQRGGAQAQAGGDPAKQLIGALLQQALTGEQGNQPATAVDPEYSAMLAPVRISNAFAMEIVLTARPVNGATDGRLEFGPYQGAQANAGYRLAYNSGAGAPALELLRVSSRGTIATLEFYDKPVNLADGQEHTITWTRDRAGAMQVYLDGEEVLSATDRGFRDPFDGFAIVNGGGDYALRKVQVDGT